MSLEYEPASELLHISVKQLFMWQSGGNGSKHSIFLRRVAHLDRVFPEGGPRAARKLVRHPRVPKVDGFVPGIQDANFKIVRQDSLVTRTYLQRTPKVDGFVPEIRDGNFWIVCEDSVVCT